jgi:hypothetical protein
MRSCGLISDHHSSEGWSTFSLAIDGEQMEESRMTIPESLKDPELIRSLCYPGPATFVIIAAICVVSTALLLLWLLAVQRYTRLKRQE